MSQFKQQFKKAQESVSGRFFTAAAVPAVLFVVALCSDNAIFQWPATISDALALLFVMGVFLAQAVAGIQLLDAKDKSSVSGQAHRYQNASRLLRNCTYGILAVVLMLVAGQAQKNQEHEQMMLTVLFYMGFPLFGLMALVETFQAMNPQNWNSFKVLRLVAIVPAFFILPQGVESVVMNVIFLGVALAMNYAFSAVASEVASEAYQLPDYEQNLVRS